MAYLMSKDKFKPLSEVIMHDMSDDQREKLAASVAAVLADLRVEDVQLLLKTPSAKEAVLKEVFAFIEQELKLQIVD